MRPPRSWVISAGRVVARDGLWLGFCDGLLA
jgi:hypothetical protein